MVTQVGIPNSIQNKNKIDVQWCESISNISRDEWEMAFPQKKANQMYDLHFCVQESKLDGIKYSILKLTENGKTIAIIPAFSYRIFLDTLAPQIIKKINKKIRIAFKTFATVKTFFLGSPISICNQLIGIPLDTVSDKRKDIFELVIREAKVKAKKENCALIMIKEIPQFIMPQWEPFLNKDFFFADSYPNSLIAVGNGLPEFPSFLRSRYKRKVAAKQKAFSKENIRVEITRNFMTQSESMLDLYFNVLEKSDVQFERLNDDFFKMLSEHTSHFAFSIMYYSSTNELLCYVVVLEDNDSYIPLYIGLDYEKIKNSEIYFNCVYKIIALAEKDGKKWVRLGQTTYETKLLMGAVFEKLYLAIHARNKIVHYVMSHFKDVFFPPKLLPHHNCINSEWIDHILQQAKENGIKIEKITNVQTD